MKIKICGITQKEFLENVNELDVDFIGFIFYPYSSRYLMKNLLVEEIKSIPDRIKKVGVFVNETAGNIIKTAALYSLDFIQLHGDEELDLVKEISKTKNIIKAFHVNEAFDFSIIKNYEKYLSYILFDTKTQTYGGSGKKFNWNLLQKYNGNTPFLLSGGITPNDLNEIKKFRHSKLAGIDINSGFEIKPGNKNIALIKNFINQLK